MIRRAVKLTISYDGTDFGGWQRQDNARSVQGDLETALGKVHGHPVPVTGAGRTDSGVHAKGQVAGFFTDIASIPVSKFTPALNRLLPGDIRVLTAESAPEDFHARFDASLRRYRYFVTSGSSQTAYSRRYTWYRPKRPLIAALNGMASTILGEQDFSSFSSAQDASASKSRFVSESSFWYEGETLVYQIAANAFLWKMVRSLVGTFLDLESKNTGNGDMAIGAMKEILACKDRRLAGPTAPPYGLFLWNVEYGPRIYGHKRRKDEESIDG
jgi:tRNA pseudouridine38-40 synthase